MKRYEGSLNAYYEVKEAKSEKAVECTTPTIWHSGRGKTLERVESQGSSGVRQREGCVDRAQRTFRATGGNGGYIPLYVCPNPQNPRHQEWSLTSTADFGNGQGRFIDCNTRTIGWGCWWWGSWGRGGMGRQEALGESLHWCSSLLWTLKGLFKKSANNSNSKSEHVRNLTFLYF